MRIALVSDAWSPQVNGVVRTLTTTVARLRADGHIVETITPDRFPTVPCPSYPEIRLALGAGRAVARLLARTGADAVHIATEGPLGWAARHWCIEAGRPFTTSFHTRFPDYVSMRTGLPSKWIWPLVRRFHAPATRIMVATPTLAAELAGQGLAQTHIWSRGVDLDLFSPDAAPHSGIAGLPGPILLYVGRIAVEKNIAAFLDAAVPGTKVVVGDGPARLHLEKAYSAVHFLGTLEGAALASAYAAAAVLVFPSMTDTFGLVMIEALACGTPVAAFPVPGPLDILGRSGSGAGALDKDLATAIRLALPASRSGCLSLARAYGWDHCTSQFLEGLQPVRRNLPALVMTEAD